MKSEWKENHNTAKTHSGRETCHNNISSSHSDTAHCHPKRINCHPEQTNRHPKQTNRHPEQTNRHPEQTNRHPELVSGSLQKTINQLKHDKWKKVKLGDYIDILSGYAFKTDDFIKSGIPVIKIKNVTPPNVTLEDLSYVSEEIAEKCRKYILNYNDILIAMTGSHINQINSVVGRVARVKYNINTLLNQRVGKILIADKKHCDYDFVYHYLSQFETKVKLANIAGGAANQANVSPKDIKNLEISLPPLATQKKIASILSAYDDLIENNKKQIKLLEEAAQKLYKQWFVKLNFPQSQKAKITDGIPKGWRKEKVGNVISILAKTKQIKTSDIQKNGKIPVIDQSRDFIAGYTNDNESLIYSERPVIVFGDHTRILKLIQFPFARGADGTQVFISSNENIKEYQLYCALVEVDLSNYSYARHFKYLKEKEILIPNIDLSIKFEAFAKKTFCMIQNLRDKITLLQSARDKLLPRLMKGDIEV